MSILTTIGSGSGIDTTQLIKDLVAAQRMAADQTLKTRQANVDAKVSSLSQLSSALTGFSTALNTLVKGGGLSRLPVSSDSSIVAVTPSGSGEPPAAATSIEVQQLAQRQTVASAAVANRNAAIGQGTLTINFGTLSGTVPTPAGFAAGSRAPVTITIGPENDSLVGLQKAINASAAGITASIVDDGSGARLVLKGETGKEQAFTISATGGLGAYAFGPSVVGGMTWTGQAKNSVLVVDGVTLERSGNSITDIVEGLKFDLQKAEVGKTVNISSDFDAETLQTAIGNYVEVYNELVGMLSEATRPGTDEASAGPLASDRTARELKRALTGLTSTPLLNGGTGPATLAEIGIKTNRDGTLSIDAPKMAAVIAANPERVHNMFVPGQSSSSPLLSIASKLGAVAPGSYQVTDVVAATSGKLVGAAVPTAFDTPVTIDGSNKNFSVTLDGRTSLTISLPEGSYATGAAMADALENAINADSVLNSFKLGLDVSWNGSAFTFTSRGVGSSTSVALTGLDATLSSRLGIASATSTLGTNVSGKIAGFAAVGIGNRLIASSQSDANGLSLNVDGSISSATISVRTTVSTLISDLQTRLSAPGGSFKSTSERLSREAASISEEMERVNASSAALKERLTIQFAAMEKAVAAFKSTQTYLQQQIDMWTKSSN